MNAIEWAIYAACLRQLGECKRILLPEERDPAPLPAHVAWAAIHLVQHVERDLLGYRTYRPLYAVN